jgi:hypothetical protein
MTSILLRWVRRTILIMSVIFAAAYMVMVGLYNLPPSPLKVKIQPVLEKCVDPYFTQRWRLFAPNPPNGNYDGWFQIRYDDGTGIRETAVLGLTMPLIAESKAHRLFPPRIDRTAINLGYALTDITTSQAKLARLTASRKAGGRLDPEYVLPAGWHQLEGAESMTDQEYFDDARKTLEAGHKQVSGQLNRLVALLTPSLRLPGRPRQARVFYTYTPITRFSERHAITPETDPPIRIADTGWMPYQAVTGA